MVLLQKHSEEIYWLERRIQFLRELDNFLDDEMPDQEQIDRVSGQFEKVKNPADVIDRLKDIYGKKLR